MADPLSTSASIIAILGLTGEVIKYLATAKDGSEDRDKIRQELIYTIGFLYILKDQAAQLPLDNNASSTMRALTMTKGPLEQFKTALELPEAKLRLAYGINRAERAIIWPFRKEDVKEILIRIERVKSLFNMALQNDYM